MAKVTIKANKREEKKKKVKGLRQQGLVPAVIYGRKYKSTPVTINLKDFQKNVLKTEAGLNLIFDLKIGKDAGVPVITHRFQRNPITDQLIHIDFMHVIMDEAIKTTIPVELVGVPEGVKEEGGVLVHGLRMIEVKCLPGDIPGKYEVDVSALKINDSLHVADLVISKKVEILSDPGEMVANVSPPTKEEEEAPKPMTPEEVAAAAEAAEGGVPVEGAADGAAKEGVAPAKEGAAPAKDAKPAKEDKKK